MMRWRFADPNNAAETSHKADLIEKIDAFWAAFAAQADDLDACCNGTLKMDIAAWMNTHLFPVSNDLCWEFRPAMSKPGHRLIFTPESRRYLHPLLDDLLARAPSLPRWEFYRYRQRSGPAEAHAYVKGRSRGKLDYADAQVALKRGDHNKIDVTFRAAGVRSAGDPDALNAAWMLCEVLCGEESLDKWIGVIDIAPAPKAGLASRLFGKAPGGGGFLALERLPAAFDALKQSILDQLPDRPTHELNLTGTGEWVGFQLRPDPNEDPGNEAGRDRMHVGSSARFDVTKATSASAFSGQRFSRFGETFAYLKLDWTGVARGERVNWRGQFEDALEPALRGANVGCIYGTAASEGFGFVELALTDVARAIQIIRETLRPQLAPQRAWLLFYEPEMEREWVGVWDDSPAPPQREDGTVN